MLSLRNGVAALASEMYQLPSPGAELVAPDRWRGNRPVDAVRGTKVYLK